MKIALKSLLLFSIVVAVFLCASSYLFASSGLEGGHADLACTECHLTQPDSTVDTVDTVDFITPAREELCANCHINKTFLEQTNSPTVIVHNSFMNIPQEMYDFYVTWLNNYNTENGTSLLGFVIYEDNGVFSTDCSSCHFPLGTEYPDIPMDNAEMCVACHGGEGNYDPGVTRDVFSSMPRIVYNPVLLGNSNPAPSDPGYDGEPPSDGDSVTADIPVPIPVAFFKRFHRNVQQELNYRIDISGPVNESFEETDSRPMSWYTGIDNVSRWADEKQMYFWEPTCDATPDGDYVMDLIPYNPLILEDVGTAYTLNLTLIAASPVELIQQLVDLVESMTLNAGIDNSLDAKLSAAEQAISDVNENNDVAAINTLQAFINATEAQRGSKISDADADTLIAEAQEIIDAINNPVCL